MTPRPHDADDSDAIGERIRAAAETVQAPDTLRRRIEQQGRPATASLPRRTAAAMAVVALLAGALILIGRDPASGGPSLADAASVALRAPTATLPTDPHGSTQAMPAVDGIRFPDYAYSKLNLRAAGVRRDRAGGREVVTVAYDDGGARIGYAIVAAPALDVPAAARTVTSGGTRYALLRADGAAIVTWRRAGRTCVLASRTASHERLLRIAAWRARS